MPITAYDLNFNINAINLVISRAFNNDPEGVAELLDAGGNREDAAYGFALGGHVNLVKEITANTPALLKFAARGYARGKHSVEVAELSREPGCIEDLLYGHAQAGNESQLWAALKSQEGAKYLPTILDGLASTNQSDLLLPLVKGTRYYSLTLQSAAKSGHRDLVQSLLTMLSISLDKLESGVTPFNTQIKIALSNILQGYTKGRHFEYAAELLDSRRLNPMHCLNALACKGVVDANDASLLIGAIDSEPTQDQIKNLLTEQFQFDLESLEPGAISTPPNLSDGETESVKLG